MDSFYLDKRFGIPRSRCKECCNAYKKEREKTHPSNRNPVARRAARKRWEDKNPEWRASYGPQWVEVNREELNARRRKGGRHYGKVVADMHKRRAREAGAPGEHSAQEWLELLEFYEHRCLCCGTMEEVHRDHVVPLIKGGSNDISNLQPLCKSCNSKKGTKITDYRGTTDRCEI